MKKLSAIILLSVYLFSATEFCELLKINVLINHFYETKKTDPSVSFTHFLLMHYITDDGNSKDNDRDEKLPFKSHSIVSNISPVLISGRTEEIISTPTLFVKTAFNNYREPFLQSSFCSRVWNPPRIS